MRHAGCRVAALSSHTGKARSYSTSVQKHSASQPRRGGPARLLLATIPFLCASSFPGARPSTPLDAPWRPSPLAQRHLLAPARSQVQRMWDALTPIAGFEERRKKNWAGGGGGGGGGEGAGPRAGVVGGYLWKLPLSTDRQVWQRRWFAFDRCGPVTVSPRPVPEALAAVGSHSAPESPRLRAPITITHRRRSRARPLASLVVRLGTWLARPPGALFQTPATF
jgi:hypothetical protein